MHDCQSLALTLRGGNPSSSPKLQDGVEEGTKEEEADARLGKGWMMCSHCRHARTHAHEHIWAELSWVSIWGPWKASKIERERPQQIARERGGIGVEVFFEKGSHEQTATAFWVRTAKTIDVTYGVHTNTWSSDPTFRANT